jgi:hypothetical protein
MSVNIYRQFANSVKAIVPNFPMNDDEIQALLEEQGLAGFVDSDASAAELVEFSELLERMERRYEYCGA